MGTVRRARLRLLPPDALRAPGGAAVRSWPFPRRWFAARGSGGGDPLEGLDVAALAEARLGGDLREAAPQEVLEVLQVADLAGVGAQGGELAVEGVGDVHVVVGRRAAVEPD